MGPIELEALYTLLLEVQEHYNAIRNPDPIAWDQARRIEHMIALVEKLL